MRRPFDRRRPLYMLAGAEQITVQPPMAGGRTIGEAVIREPLQQICIIRSFRAVFCTVNTRIHKAPQIDHAGIPILRKLTQIVAVFPGSSQILLQAEI